MKTAFIFPGQGSQYVGMGRRPYDGHEEVRGLYDLAGDIAGMDVKALSFEGPEGELNRDVNAQVSVYVANEAYRLAALKDGLSAQAVTGYSMGFYNALVAAGSVSFSDGLRMVIKAGELAMESGGGTMGAIIGLGLSEVEGICKESSSEGGVWVSNVNAARQVLVSGHAGDVQRALSLAVEKGALSACALDMGAAYHSPMMEGAVGRFMEYLRGVEFKAPALPLLSYIDAAYLGEGPAIMHTVGRQLSARVLWKDSVMRLIGDGVDSFIEVGPGSALTRMVRWVDRGVGAAPVSALLGYGDS